MVRTKVSLLVSMPLLLLIGASLKGMYKNLAVEAAAAATSSRGNNLVSFRTLSTSARLLAPMPTEYHTAAVELFDRVLLCFIDGASEAVKRAGMHFLTGLQEIIDRCNGPLGKVWFRAPVEPGFVIQSTEHTLQGYFEEIARLNKSMEEPVRLVLGMLDKQEKVLRINARGRTDTEDGQYNMIKRADGGSKRWSVPRGCWVLLPRDEQKCFYDPTEKRWQTTDFARNLVNVIMAHARDTDEEFDFFLADFEAHVNSPFFRGQRKRLLECCGDRLEIDHNKNVVVEAPGYRWEFTFMRGDSRIDQINRVISACYYAESYVFGDLNFQKLANIVKDEELFASRPVLEGLVRKLESRPVVMAHDTIADAGNGRALMIAAASKTKSDAWLRMLEEEAGGELPALPAAVAAAHQPDALVHVNASSRGGWVDDEDSSDLAEL
jgi:hypothetical protein